MQEKRKDELPKKLVDFATIGSFEDFISQQYSTIIVSLVRSESFEETGGALMNSQKLIDFFESRVKLSAEKASRIVILGKISALNSLWKEAFYSAKGVQLIET